MATREIQEIERRFLLKHKPKVAPNKTIDISQYYRVMDGVVKRLRFSHAWEGTNPLDLEIEYLHKDSARNVEVHEDITYSDAIEWIMSAERKVKKFRSVYQTDKHKFEVDEIEGVTFILMEVELDYEGQEIEFPESIKECIACEVTGIKGLSNYALATKIKKD